MNVTEPIFKKLMTALKRFFVKKILRFRRRVLWIRGTKQRVFPPTTIVNPPMPPHVPYGLRGLPFRLWPKYNRLLRLGRP
jgi:hypothetical protein